MKKCPENPLPYLVIEQNMLNKTAYDPGNKWLTVDPYAVHRGHLSPSFPQHRPNKIYGITH
jgi:hypothetical protein